MLGDNAETQRRRVGTAEVWVRPRLSGRIWRYATENGRVGSSSLPGARRVVEIVPRRKRYSEINRAASFLALLRQ